MLRSTFRILPKKDLMILSISQSNLHKLCKHQELQRHVEGYQRHDKGSHMKNERPRYELCRKHEDKCFFYNQDIRNPHSNDIFLKIEVNMCEKMYKNLQICTCISTRNYLNTISNFIQPTKYL